MKYLPLPAIPLLQACTTIKPNPTQQAHIQQRYESTKHTLEEKAAYFESKIPLQDGIVKLTREFDNTCQYLTYLAAKRKTSPSTGLDQKIAQSINAISKLPDDDIGTNEYTQLFFAYSLMQDHPSVVQHANHLNNLFFKEYNCALPAE